MPTLKDFRIGIIFQHSGRLDRNPENLLTLKIRVRHRSFGKGVFKT